MSGCTNVLCVAVGCATAPPRRRAPAPPNLQPRKFNQAGTQRALRALKAGAAVQATRLDDGQAREQRRSRKPMQQRHRCANVQSRAGALVADVCTDTSTDAAQRCERHMIPW